MMSPGTSINTGAASVCGLQLLNAGATSVCGLKLRRYRDIDKYWCSVSKKKIEKSCLFFSKTKDCF